MHRLALADGHGALISDEEARVAAVDELLHVALPELVALGEHCAYAHFEPLADDCRRPLARSCAALIRLLDDALARHARDTGYCADVWRASVTTFAGVAAADLRRPVPEDCPLPDALRRVARLIAEALTALPRDRIGVPEPLAMATAELLVVYAAAAR